VARANGRFPQAQVVLAPPGGDGTKLVLRATFGILVSHDGGKSWRWVCERALGYEGQWDPPIAFTRDGTLYVGLARGVASTSDDGCTVALAPEIDGETIKDLTTDGAGETVWAIAGRPGKKASVWRKPPRKPWERMPGKGLEDLNLLTIEVAPGRSERVYVSGEPYDTIRGRLYRSDDGGKTFEGKENDQPPDGPFFIAAVDPVQADRVLVRHLHGKGSELLLTTDAGKTWKNVLSMTSAMFGFAKSHDGKTYWAGSGLATDGIFRSTDRGEHFTRVTNRGVLCLTAAGDHLFACENSMSVGAPVLAGSTDQGNTFAPLSRFADIRGPLACADDDRDADTGAAFCAGGWQEIQALITPRPEAVASSPSSATPDGGAATSSAPRRKSACGCRAVGAAGMDRGLFMAGLVPLVVWARHRRRRGSGRAHPGSA
jgi:photosystem II stability/assembly factor-like uncharacterized protein